ncbi:MAG: hypothetical protein OXF08_00475 [Bacteroidetes bacterium]|nr:hypothetical protein [Bacteroidota bacterium]
MTASLIALMSAWFTEKDHHICPPAVSQCALLSRIKPNGATNIIPREVKL